MSLGDGKTLLLVEDTSRIALAKKASLETHGYRVFLASSGEAARAHLEAGLEVDLILIDIDQGTDGTLAAQSILKDHDLPIVFLSSHDAVENSSITVFDASIKMSAKLLEAKQKAKADLRSIQEKNQVLETILQTATDGYWLCNKEGRLLEANDAYCLMSGYDRTALLTMKIADIEAIEDASQVAARMVQLMAMGSGHFTGRHRKKNGSFLDVEVSVKYLDIDGGLFVCFYRDITERRQMEESLRAKNEEINHYFSSALDLLCIANTDGRFIRLNPEWEKVLGYSLEDLEGHSFLDFVHPEDLEATLAAIARLKAQEEVLSFENRYRRKDGSYRWIEWRSRPEGQTIYAAARDMTDRRLAEDRITALLKEKELILKEVHHRIKNNMGSIMGLLSLQAMAVKDSMAKAALEDAGGRVRSMKVLYEKTYLSESFGGLSARDYLSSLVDDIVADFPNRRILKVEKSLEDFFLDSRTLLPLGIIINEVLTNAMKHAFAGRSEGRLSISASRAEGLVTIVMEDDGTGLPESISLENSSGFGLMLVGELAKQLGGELRLERVGGTRLVLRFKS